MNPEVERRRNEHGRQKKEIGTRYRNRKVANNKDKFLGNGFMFRLTEEEARGDLDVQQFHIKLGSGMWKPPFAFTEKGIYTLMTLLKSKIATGQSQANSDFQEDEGLHC